MSLALVRDLIETVIAIDNSPSDHLSRIAPEKRPCVELAYLEYCWTETITFQPSREN